MFLFPLKLFFSCAFRLFLVPTDVNIPVIIANYGSICFLQVQFCQSDGRGSGAACKAEAKPDLAVRLGLETEGKANSDADGRGDKLVINFMDSCQHTVCAACVKQSVDRYKEDEKVFLPLSFPFPIPIRTPVSIRHSIAYRVTPYLYHTMPVCETDGFRILPPS